MKHLWAPWRVEYIRQEKPKGCILCEAPRKSDDAVSYIVYRGAKNFVMMNLYPYNTGHVMVAPYRHVAEFEELTDEELHEHAEILKRCVAVLKEVFTPGGFNLGMNLGRAAGAGIDDHMHTHVVPRWVGDTNFMSVMADVRVVPEAIMDTYQRIKEKF